MSSSHSNNSNEFISLESADKIVQASYEITIKSIFETFCDKMVQVQLYQSDAKDMANKKLSQLSDYTEILKEKPELEDYFFDGKNMYFRNAEDGSLMQFGHITRSIEDIREAVNLHQNRQYQLFLAEAYEAFEDFLEEAYAYAGYIDKNLWSCNDFGNVSLAEVNQNLSNFNFFLDKVRKKKEKPRSILNQLRKNFPAISKLEQENKLKINLKLVITLIEKIRHIVVHNSGKVSDKQDFIDKIFEDSGLAKKGEFHKKHPEFFKLIQSLFRDDYPNKLIVLLELKLLQVENSAYRSIFDDLCGYLMTHAYILFNCLERHQKQNNCDS